MIKSYVNIRERDKTAILDMTVVISASMLVDLYDVAVPPRKRNNKRLFRCHFCRAAADRRYKIVHETDCVAFLAGKALGLRVTCGKAQAK